MKKPSMDKFLQTYAPPSPPQSAEGAYEAAEKALDDVCPGNHRSDSGIGYICGFSCPMCRLAIENVRAALDACIREVLAERGHALECKCYRSINGNQDDPRCVPPSWLPELKNG